MAYVEPETVLSPRNRVRSVRVVYKGGRPSWSVALIDWDDGESVEEVVGFRWNGEEGESGMGNPQSRARPTWMLLPDELAGVVLEAAERLQDSQYAELRSAYSEMAADQAREAEAEAWGEGLIQDAGNQEG